MRRTLATLTTAFAVVLSSVDASACCLSDWLYGRSSSPYVVGYAPIATAPTAVAAPVVAPPVMSARPVTYTAPVVTSGVYQAQRPAYIDNPSVYTGLPVTGNVQTSYRATTTGVVPIPSTTIVPSPLTTSPAPTATLNYRGQAPVVTYRPQVTSAVPGGPITVPTPTGAPATALPATPVAPVFVNPPPQPRGFRGFFGRLFGTGYRTSYYSAPVTYYRPVNTIDPVTGAPVIVQQPCTSSVQQLQRTPFSTVQSVPAPATAGAAPGCCQTPPVYAPPAAGYGQVNPGYGQINAGVGQVGATGAMGSGVAPIPSTVPGGYGSGGNLAPLQGAPPAASGDMTRIAPPELTQPVAPPVGHGGGVGAPGQLNSNPGSSSEVVPSNNPPAQPSSNWQLPNADDSTAMVQPRYRSGAPEAQRSTGGGVEPIAAPEDYVSPFRSRSAPAVAPPPTGSFQAPPLPQRSTTDPGTLTAVSTRSSVVNDRAFARPVNRSAVGRLHPVGQSNSVRPMNSVRPSNHEQRDSNWFPVSK